MGRNAFAIIAIYLCTSVAWIVLGASVESRTYHRESDLGQLVESSWGAPQAQAPPAAFTTRGTTPAPLPIERSRIQAALQLEQRQKGLLWFPTYRVRFHGEYFFVNRSDSDAVTLRLAFPAPDQGTLSPTEKQHAGRGWVLTWRYTNLVTGYSIGVVLPEKLQPGPLAGRISYFAPLLLLFFFFLMFVMTKMKNIHLHPVHYFFLATSFFAFHLLLAYLVDHISIHVAFAIASAVSVFPVVSYLRIVVGPHFAWREAALTQLVYLVLFSYAFFFKGYTGLAITIGAIVTLFVVMQLTARVEWGPRDAAADQDVLSLIGSSGALR